MSRPLQFTSISEAVSVLGKYKTSNRLTAVEALGFNLNDYTQAELADFVCSSREKVSMALTKMGRGRRVKMEEAA